MFLEIWKNLQTYNIIKIETLEHVFPSESCGTSKNTFFTEHLWTTAFGYSYILLFLPLFHTKDLWQNYRFTDLQIS